MFLLININKYDTDVLVIGGGLAGISAAVEAARSGVRVTIVVTNKIFSGSSFSPYTWGLGIISPYDELDKKDLLDSIYDVGCGLVDRELSFTLVDNIEQRIRDLEYLGIKFKAPQNIIGDETLVPCFDRKHRKWFGFTFDHSKQIFFENMKELNINILEHQKIVKLFTNKELFTGALGINENNQLTFFKASSVVIATGGFGGLFKHNLNTEDINGEGLILALSTGCELINLEFLQFIPGYLKPKYKTIFSETAFKYATLEDQNGNSILKKYFPECVNEREILNERSTHGPFSSRLNSKYVDIALFKESISNKEYQGARVKYDVSISSSEGFLTWEYFDWLKETRGIKYDEEVIITTFAHASNGGIRINKDAETSVKGIYAAGEVTGGMHGADRIGGLSTANALVFGKIAGQNAALFAKNQTNCNNENIIELEINSYIRGIRIPRLPPNLVIETIRELMWKNGNVVRNNEQLNQALQKVRELSKDSNEKNNSNREINFYDIIKAKNYIKLSSILFTTMLLREESRGSHYREDYPFQRNTFDKFIVVSEDRNGIIKYKWEAPIN